MIKQCYTIFIIIVVVTADVELDLSKRSKQATLKPLSVCCEIPELGDSKPLAECSNPKPMGPCNDTQCIFEKSGFLIDKDTLNKETYKQHLLKWVENRKEWTKAIDKVIEDCIDKDIKKYLDAPCKAYDVFFCTGVAMLKKCPESSWLC